MSAPNRFAEAIESSDPKPAPTARTITGDCPDCAELRNDLTEAREQLEQCREAMAEFCDTRISISSLEYTKGETTQKELVNVTKEYADRFAVLLDSE